MTTGQSLQRRPRFYAQRVLWRHQNGDPGLVSIVGGPYGDLVTAWRICGMLRDEEKPEIMFIAGELLSVAAAIRYDTSKEE